MAVRKKEKPTSSSEEFEPTDVNGGASSDGFEPASVNGDASSDGFEWSDDDVISSEELESSNGSEDEHIDSSDLEQVEESDSSEDEVAPRNTVGDVPLEWYKDEDHIGYNREGKKIIKQQKKDKLSSFVEGEDDPTSWRRITDEYNDEVVELSKKEVKLIGRLIKGETPHVDVDAYPDYVDWFEHDGFPLSNAPEPKRRFVPSKWEQKKVVKLVRAIRNGWIKLDQPKEEENKLYLLWGDDNNAAENKKHGLSYIPAPKPKLPGHEESYNPPIEYIPTEEEKSAYQLMYEEDQPKFIPTRFTSLRLVPAYAKSLREMFDRCLDQYLCPRTRKKKINIDPESLKPKLPNRKDLRPYPNKCYFEFRGHNGPVNSISVDSLGQYLASGSMDGTVRVWEIETGRCLKIWEIEEPVRKISWNPSSEKPILAVVLEYDVLLLNSELGEIDVQIKTKELLKIDAQNGDDSGDSQSAVNWIRHEKLDAIRLKHFKTVASVEWHFKGDYFTTVVPSGDSKAVLVHQLSKKHSDKPFKKLPGIPVSAVFHPIKKIFFVATKKFVQVYDLAKGQRIKKLDTGLKEISSISIHPAGDNVIVGSREGKLCWFDLDLSTRPYKTLKAHSKDITRVEFHQKYPLFASGSDDCTAYVFHSTVYSDLNQNPLIVPLEILRGHKTAQGRGVLDCKFHPKQPWLFTAGSDSVIKLYCH